MIDLPTTLNPVPEKAITMKLLVLVSLFLCPFSASLSATTCEDYDQYTHFLTRLQTGGDIEAVALSGNYAYLANSLYPDPDFMVVDISDPYSPPPIP